MDRRNAFRRLFQLRGQAVPRTRETRVSGFGHLPNVLRHSVSRHYRPASCKNTHTLIGFGVSHRSVVADLISVLSRGDRSGVRQSRKTVIKRNTTTGIPRSERNVCHLSYELVTPVYFPPGPDLASMSSRDSLPWPWFAGRIEWDLVELFNEFQRVKRQFL